MTLFSSLLSLFFLGFIHLYRFCLKPFLAGSCRFWPSCSYYAEEALKKHGVFKGGFLTIARVCRCHPWGREGVDPVPEIGSHFKCWFRVKENTHERS